MALAGAGLRCANPAASTRAIGCADSLPSFMALSNSPASTSAEHVLNGPLRLDSGPEKQALDGERE